MCLHSLSVKTEDAFGVPVNQSVPCGHCIECLKDKQNSWKIRLTEEARDHLYVYFFTLTYNNQSVPYVYSDTGEKCLYPRKSDIQLWIKRHRIKFERYFKRDIDFKYFICAEYGPNTGRPHYHGVFFTDISETFIGSMFADWRELYGFTKFELLGKKKVDDVLYHVSATTLRNTVVKYRNLRPMLNFILTNLPHLDGFRRLST